MKLVYVTTARMPTEKAHGFQIAKMCEAFASQGVDVELWHPRRAQPFGIPEGVGPAEFYGIRPNFRVRALGNIDVFRIERFVPDGIFALVFSIHRIVWSLFAALRARRHHADLYYTRDPDVAQWLTALGLPTYLEAHGLPTRLGRWSLRRTAGRTYLKGAAGLTAFICDGLISLGFPQTKVRRLPDAVDPSAYASLPSFSNARATLDLPAGAAIVGYIGRFQTLGLEKGIEELITAVGEVVKQRADVMLLCVGGPMEVVPGYLELARGCGIPDGSVRFVDRVPNVEVPLWIHACDVVTIPWPRTRFSEHMTSPLKLFEYMAAGVPIVASDLSSLREVLADGENSLLVEPGDPHALGEAIDLLLEDRSLGERLARQAAADVQAYTWHARSAQVLRQVSYGYAVEENAEDGV